MNLRRWMLQKEIIYAFLITVFLTSCADYHTILRKNPELTGILSTRDSFYISLSPDGIYGDEVYPSSGLALSQIIRSSMLKYVRHVDVATSVESYEAALKSARHKNCNYLIFPLIFHWENHVTEWNAIPDKVKVKIEVVRAEDDVLLDSVIIEGTSGLATLGGDQPQDLLLQPIDDFISRMFNTTKQ